MTHDGRGQVTLGPRFERAFQYALHLHAEQVRKASGVPYMAHLMSVAALVLEDGGSEEEAIAALLHDAIEDQGGDRVRQEIRARFGERVAAIVEGCTDADTMPKPPWRERKERYLASLATATPDVLRVSAADKLHNVRSLLRTYRSQGERVWGAFNGGRSGTLWYQAALARAIAARSDSWLASELARAVAALEELVERDSP
ncbi:MAG: HD domain-containing protein [Anaerolineae bacterium]|nr:HD domain-containing protein [Anaerolineae bacterium]